VQREIRAAISKTKPMFEKSMQARSPFSLKTTDRSKRVLFYIHTLSNIQSTRKCCTINPFGHRQKTTCYFSLIISNGIRNIMGGGGCRSCKCIIILGGCGIINLWNPGLGLFSFIFFK
jgi:hypothetical protein